jgi:capsular polysaccharide biosynthesis protein/tetratricopeptide (TPR) repeat protein
MPKKIAIVGSSHVSWWKHAIETRQLPQPGDEIIFIGRGAVPIWGDFVRSGIAEIEHRVDEIFLLVGDFRHGNRVLRSDRFLCGGDVSGNYLNIDKALISDENDRILFELVLKSLEELRGRLGSRLRILFWSLTFREFQNRENGRYGGREDYRHPVWNLGEVIDRFREVAIDTTPLLDRPIQCFYLDASGHPNFKGHAFLYRLLQGQGAPEAFEAVRADFASRSRLLFPADADRYRVDITGNSAAFRAIAKAVDSGYISLPPNWAVKGTDPSRDGGRYDRVVYLSGLYFQDETPEQVRARIAEEQAAIGRLGLGERVVVIFWDAWVREVISERPEYRDKYIPRAEEGRVGRIEEAFAPYRVGRLSGLAFDEANGLVEFGESFHPSGKGYAVLFHLMAPEASFRSAYARYRQMAEYCLDGFRVGGKPAERPSSGDVGPIREAAREAMRAAQWERAVECWSRLLNAADGQQVLAYDRGGVSLMNLGRFEEAEQWLLEGMRRFPDHALLAARYAGVAMRRRDWPTAVDRWTSYRRHFGGLAHGFAQEGLALANSGKLAEAESLLREAEPRWPEHREIAVNLAVVAMRRRDWETAAARWAALRDRFEPLAKAYEQGAVALLNLGRLDEAERLLQAGLKHFPDDAPLKSRLAEASRRWEERHVLSYRERLPRLRGSFEGVGAAGELCGWAVDPDEPGYRVPVYLGAGGRPVGSVVADQVRENAETGDGVCGFASGPLALSVLRELRVGTEIRASFDAEGRFELPNSPVALDLPALERLALGAVLPWRAELQAHKAPPEGDPAGYRIPADGGSLFVARKMPVQDDPAIHPRAAVVLDGAVVEGVRRLPPFLKAVVRARVVGGVYRKDGTLEQAALGSSSLGRFQLADRTLTSRATQHIDAECLYGGLLIDHYGHFVIEGLARFHAFHRFETLPIVLTTPSPEVERAAELPRYMRDLFLLLNVPLERIRPIRETTAIGKLIVPKVGMRWWDYLDPEHRQALAAQVRAGLGGDYPRERQGHIYLSRSRLSTRHDGHVVCGEAQFEDYLREEGFTVLYPETLPVREQLRLLCAAESAVGFVGSAFHSLLLCPDVPDRVFYLNRRKSAVNPQFPFIDRALNINGRYVDGTVKSSARATLVDFEAVSRALVDAGLVRKPFAARSRDLEKEFGLLSEWFEIRKKGRNLSAADRRRLETIAGESLNRVVGEEIRALIG